MTGNDIMQFFFDIISLKLYNKNILFCLRNEKCDIHRLVLFVTFLIVYVWKSWGRSSLKWIQYIRFAVQQKKYEKHFDTDTNGTCVGNIFI